MRRKKFSIVASNRSYAAANILIEMSLKMENAMREAKSVFPDTASKSTSSRA